MQTWPAPAKLNRFLHIVGRRADGYHRLQTVFQFLDYCDEISFEVTDDGRLEHLTPLPGIPAHQDLLLRAARLLREHSGTPLGVRMRIHKRIPMGGGLGGGSSDAATVLVALNHYWQLGYGAPELERLGLQLGADVPIFVRGRAAWAEGVGEELTELPGLDEPWYCVAAPEVHVSTAEIFTAADLTRNTPPITIADFLAGAGGNDCEALVRRRYPVVDQAIRWLQAHADAHPACCIPARMTGTGACVFAGLENQAVAEAICAQMPAEWHGFVAKGCNRSPLLSTIDTELRASTRR